MLSLLSLFAALVAPPMRSSRSAVKPLACRMVSAPRPGSMAEARSQGIRPYGEESRRYRRTVYRHEDWLKHRSETRLLRNLQGTFTSGVVRSLLSEVVAVLLIAQLMHAATFGSFHVAAIHFVQRSG